MDDKKEPQLRNIFENFHLMCKHIYYINLFLSTDSHVCVSSMCISTFKETKILSGSAKILRQPIYR